MCKKYFLLFVTVCLLCSGAAQSQSKSTLENNKKKIEDEIAQTSKLLEQTRKNKKSSVEELELISKNISNRQKIVVVLNKEITTTDSKIQKHSVAIERLSGDIAKLKNEYARMLQSSYLHRNSYSKIMYVLASKSFSQAYRRILYIRQYSDYQKKQVALIEAKQVALNENISSLQREKDLKDKLLKEETKEKEKLQKEQQVKNKVVKDLEKQEKQLKADIAKKQKKVNELNAQIQKIIKAEIAASQKKAQAEGKKTDKTTVYALTPEEKNLSNNFAANKSRLPWPTEKGTVSEYFGTHDHPTIKNVKVTNNGINIITERGGSARAVFDGKVTNVGTIYGLKFVMIRHGEYTTVYSNLDDVSVKAGETVKTKQRIGRIYTSDDGNTELQFQVWKGTTKMDPVGWIAK
ncbi:MAG: peptidoglycan DD-metalloendopeptidase family protein [Bacteroidales bacterium]|jgi:septal ring factor EnvC (AmiA/AmiB activator)|nr:peptidoglycan DD-metalloendopeptidase family protein [Bacteroidales bacterium]